MYITNLFFLLLMLTSHTVVASTINNTNKMLKAGIKEAPPFVIKSKDNTWSGISVELWERIAKRNDFKYQFEERTLKNLFDGIKNSSLQVGIGAVTLTPEREKVLDFSYPFYSTGIGIAVAKNSGNPISQILKNLLSVGFLKVLSLLVAVILIIGFIIWFIEHRQNSRQFDKNLIKGIGAGFWWSAVTMTTAGYGDKTPITFLGRLVAVIWMFASIIIISSFTAAIAASLTVTQLETIVQSADDLPGVRVATITDSSSETYLKQNRLSYTGYETLADALINLQEKNIDALVYDVPILRYYINLEYSDSLAVLPDIVQKQDYGFVLPSNSPLRESINQSLLNETKTPEWKQVLNRYLGN